MRLLGLAGEIFPELVDSHDGSSGASATGLNVGDTVLVAVWVDEFADAITAQTDAWEQSADIICIGVDVGEAIILGRRDRGAQGCVECLARWLGKGAAGAHGASHSRACPAPWPETFRLEVLSTVIEALKAPVKTPASARVLRGDFRRWSSHRIAPHPHCSKCLPTAGELLDVYADLTGAEPIETGPDLRQKSLKSLEPGLRESFLGARLSLIRDITHATKSHLFPMAFALMPIDDGRRLEVGVGRTGRADLDRSIAIIEAVERFCGFQPGNGHPRIRASRSELGDAALDPRSLILHDPSQLREPEFKLLPYDDSLVIDWAWGLSMRTGALKLVPEQVVYYRLPVSRDRPVNRFVYEISNGCSIGASLTEAALHGLFEVIERDAYLCTWYGRLGQRCIDPASLTSDRARSLIARIEGAGYRVRLLDLSAGIDVPAIGAFLISEDPDAPAAVVTAAGAHDDPRAAIESALVEAATNIIDLGGDENKRRRARGKTLIENPELVVTSADHVDQCRPIEALERLDFLVAEGPTDRIDDIFPRRGLKGRRNLRERWTSLCTDVLRIGSDIIVVDQTSAALAATGLRCVKVLVPGLLPMTFGHQYRRISNARLALLAEPTTAPKATATVLPHPFP